jgi:formylglycine-generating enzyme required for sulfatase activity
MEMANSVREKLVELIAADEQELLSNSHKLSGLLFDYYPSFRKEIRAILTALDERIPEELNKSRNEPSKNILITRLTQKLLDQVPMSIEAAQWAVESWALALKIIAPTELQAQQPASPPPAPQRIKDLSGSDSLVRYEGERLWVMLAPGVEMEFIRVPEGDFVMGTDPTDDHWGPQADEQPQKKVCLDEYWMGRYPVTCAQYAAFIQATKRKAPYGWMGDVVPPGKERHPVASISWQDAVDFCDWASRAMHPLKLRLPSEAEWEKAARGTDGRIFPWIGNSSQGGRNDLDGGAGATTPVGKYSPSGDSPYGCADVAGNVCEWVNDWYDPDYYCNMPRSNPPGPINGTSKVCRGGSWYHNYRCNRVAARFHEPPEKMYTNFGFRCAAVNQAAHAVQTVGKQIAQSGPKSTLQREGDNLWAMLAPGIIMEFVRVPQGEFLMGSDAKNDPNCQADEMPQRKVWLDEYWMGRYPVTCAQYAAFLQATQGSVNRTWGVYQKERLLLRIEMQPVMKVSWQEAVDFCVWASEVLKPLELRLPSEAEWEKAARGTDGRIFPWGNQWDALRCKCTISYEDFELSMVGKYSPQGDSPYGCADMSGLVDEWCVDWYYKDSYKFLPNRNPLMSIDSLFKVHRGGNCRSDKIRTLHHFRAAGRGCAFPNHTSDEIGFRCAAILRL